MAMHETDRNELHNRLAEVLGGGPAGTLMAYLPPVGWADVATKGDLVSLGRELRGEMGSLGSELRAEIGSVRSEIGSVRSEMRAGTGSVRSDMSALEDRMTARLHEALNAQTRSLYVGLSGILAAYSLVIAGAVSFLG